jgi:hypothetical protein
MSRRDTPERTPSPKPSPRLYLNPACGSTIGLTARVNCNSSPPVPTTGRRFSYLHASEGMKCSRCSGGLRPPRLRLAVYRRSESAATDRGGPAKDALPAYRLGPDARALPYYVHNNPVKRGLVTSPWDWPWSRRGGEVLFPARRVSPAYGPAGLSCPLERVPSGPRPSCKQLLNDSQECSVPHWKQLACLRLRKSVVLKHEHSECQRGGREA